MLEATNIFLVYKLTSIYRTQRELFKLKRQSEFFRFFKEERSMTLDQLKPGNKCRVKKLMVHDQLGQRLLDMGVYPGLDPKGDSERPSKGPHGSVYGRVLRESAPR
jgi:ferrous iron transport protein A